MTSAQLDELRRDRGAGSEAAAIVLSRAGEETGPGEYKLVGGEWVIIGQQPSEEYFDAVLQLLSLLLKREGEPHQPPIDPGWQDPANKSWTDEARWVLHYGLEGGLDWDYIQDRLKELGPYVSPSTICSYCGEPLTDEDIAVQQDYAPDERLCERCH